MNNINNNNYNNSSVNNCFGNSQTNNNFAYNNFNNNANNLWEKPFKENMKDSTLVKRNVRLIEEKNLDNWMSEYLDELNKINIKVKEMEYYDLNLGENNFNSNDIREKSEALDLIFNKIVLSIEIFNYNIKKLKEKEAKKSKENIY